MLKGQINYCPKCGKLSFGYDPHFQAYCCFSPSCTVGIDYDKKYGEGLTNRPAFRNKSFKNTLERRLKNTK